VTSTRFTFSVKDAAESCDVNPRTITRKLPALQEHGAVKGDDGSWQIPPEALEAVGLKPGRSRVPADVNDMSHDTEPVSQGAVTPDIRIELATVTTERDMLRDLLAAERGHRRAVEQTLALALRQLEPGKPATAELAKRRGLRAWFAGLGA